VNLQEPTKPLCVRKRHGTAGRGATAHGWYNGGMDYMHYGLGLSGFVGPLFIVMLVWSLLWKGLALWRAAKRDDLWWFLIFLVVNTLGILEIIYLFAVTGAKLSDFTSKLTKGEHHHHH